MRTTTTSLIGGFLLMAVWLSGCAVIQFQHPLPPNASERVARDFKGLWQIDANDDSMIILVGSTSNGITRAAMINEDDGGLELVKGDIVITTTNDAHYISYRITSGDEDSAIEECPGCYFILKYHPLTDDTIVLWIPHDEVIATAVESNVLSGTVESDGFSASIIVSNTSGRLLRILEETDGLPFFNLEEPIVARRLSE